MEEATEFKVLNAEGFTMEMKMQDNDKINTVFNYVKDNSQKQITLDEIAALVSMTVPSFCCYFKKQKTFTKFVSKVGLATLAISIKHSGFYGQECFAISQRTVFRSGVMIVNPIVI